MPAINLLTVASSLPADAVLMFYSPTSTPKVQAILATDMLAAYATLVGAETLENKTLDPSCVVGVAGAEVPAAVSQINLGTAGSYITFARWLRSTVAVPTVADNAIGTVAVTVTGAATTDMVFVQANADDARKLIISGRVTAADTVTLSFANETGASFTGLNVEFDVLVIRLGSP